MTLPTNFALGDIVKVIDPQEPPSEWATFTIIEKFSNSYRLSPLDKFTYEPLWVTANEISLTQLKKEKSPRIYLAFNFNFSLL